jgi:hypothetical protein
VLVTQVLQDALGVLDALQARLDLRLGGSRLLVASSCSGFSFNLLMSNMFSISSLELTWVLAS